MPWQRLPQRREVQPAVLQSQVGPPQSRLVLGTDHQIDATAPRIRVDKERVARQERESGREQRCARTAAASHHGEHRTPAPASLPAFRGLRQHPDEFPLVIGQRHDALGAHGDRGLPIGAPGSPRLSMTT